MLKGARSRPRLALVGDFETEISVRYGQLFPTVWSAKNFLDLLDQVDFREIDIVIIGQGIGLNTISKVANHRKAYWDLVDKSHVICFADNYIQLPGPFTGTIVSNNRIATSEQHELPPTTLSFYTRLVLDLSSVDSVRGWRHYYLQAKQGEVDNEEFKKLEVKYNNFAIVLDYHDQVPLAVNYVRDESRLGIACLPPFFSQYEWVELIAIEWAKLDQEKFPGFGDWSKVPEWMIREEEALVENIKDLNNQKHDAIKQLDKEIDLLSQDLAKTSLAANKGLRRLLTAQHDELVEEVAAVFTEVGYEVEVVDELLEKGAQKREDLRLRLPSTDDKNWVAIVEIRGYSKSAGRTADLQRLARFANLFQQETGRLPDKRIYVINGQIEIQNPSHRQEPLASATEDVELFAEDEGIVISTIELFQLAKMMDQKDYRAVRESIRRTKGRWTLDSAYETVVS